MQPSSSTEVLDLLLGAGLDRVEAANLLSGAAVPGHRPSTHGGHEDQRSSSPLVGGQSVPQTATKTFETTVMETLARFGEKLEYLTARVEGSDTSTAIAPSDRENHKGPPPAEIGQTVHWTSQLITRRRSRGWTKNPQTQTIQCAPWFKCQRALRG